MHELPAFLAARADEIEKRTSEELNAEVTPHVVAAIRAVLAVHRTFLDRADDVECMGCGLDAMEESATEHIDECPTLRALALMFADHPDYRQEWAPDA